MTYIDVWLASEQKYANAWILTELEGGRQQAFALICDSVFDHLIGDDILERLGYRLSAAVVRNRLPTSKRIRSGDVGEVLATDYVLQKTPFRVPLKRLRFKDDRNTSMRGDDLIAIDSSTTPT